MPRHLEDAHREDGVDVALRRAVVEEGRRLGRRELEVHADGVALVCPDEGAALVINGCGGLKLYPLPSTAIAPSGIYIKNGPGCTQDTSNGPSYLRTYDFYAASATQAANVDPSTFPTLTVTTSQ